MTKNMFGIRYIALSWLRITWVRNDAPYLTIFRPFRASHVALSVLYIRDSAQLDRAAPYLTICRPFRASHVALSVLYIRDSAQLDRAAPPRFPRSPEGAAYKSEAV